MASKQIAARLQGDDYQSRFFWYQASQLLSDEKHVAMVKLEDGDAPHVDDVTVVYHPPGRRDAGRDSGVDFFQVKFHVDQSKAYSAEGFLDPVLIGSETKSLLQRFYHAYGALRSSGSWFSLGLVSNWTWEGEDTLAKAIRHSGALPDDFFTAGKRSRLGKIRESWKSHLGTDDETFADFGGRLRLKLNYFGFADFNAALNDRLYRAGLVPIDPTKDSSPYDELARKLIQTGQTELDTDALRTLCEREGLLREDPPLRGTRRLGFRTFVPFAERIEAETDAFVCGAEHFDGRHPRGPDSWKEVTAGFSSFVDEQRPLLSGEQEVLLDCHASGALAAGYLLTERASAWPLGPRPKLERQQPSKTARSSSKCWETRETDTGTNGPDLALAISLTHETSEDVIEHVRSIASVGRVLNFVPRGGSGPRSVADADHADALVAQFLECARKNRKRGGTCHLFVAAPNFFTYMLGARLRALGDVVSYEFDFDGPEPRQYYPALRLPLDNKKAISEDNHGA